MVVAYDHVAAEQPAGSFHASTKRASNAARVFSVPDTSGRYWLREQERLDVSLRYSITKNLIAKLQLNNLTSEPVEQGYLQPYAMNRYEIGRDKTYSLDLTYKF